MINKYSFILLLAIHFDFIIDLILKIKLFEKVEPKLKLIDAKVMSVSYYDMVYCRITANHLVAKFAGCILSVIKGLQFVSSIHHE